MSEERITFCRICEAECGVIAIVDKGRIVDVKADKLNRHSRGFMCTKAKAMIDVVYDPDRVLTPLKRVGAPGEFEACSWDEALDDIARRLKHITIRSGPKSFAVYAGNPTGSSTCGPFALTGLRDAIGRRGRSVPPIQLSARLASRPVQHAARIASAAAYSTRPPTS